MRKLLVAALLVLSLLAVFITPTSAQTTLPTKTKDDIEKIINDNISKIQAFQDIYLKNKGRYMQVLWNLPDPPTRLTLSTKLTEKPIYQDEDAQYFFDSIGLSSSLPMRLKIDTYDGPGGQGYIVTVEVKDSKGLTFTRAWNFGEEIYREKQWSEVREDVVK